MQNRKFKIYRGDNNSGELIDYSCNISEGMVVLDAIHRIQADDANDMACRWNCKAGKCGSCSVEINGKPKLACMTRMNEYSDDETITITPLKSFPVIKDVVTDVTWNYKQNQKIKPFSPVKNNKGKYKLSFVILKYISIVRFLDMLSQQKYLQDCKTRLSRFVSRTLASRHYFHQVQILHLRKMSPFQRQQ